MKYAFEHISSRYSSTKSCSRCSPQKITLYYFIIVLLQQTLLLRYEDIMNYHISLWGHNEWIRHSLLQNSQPLRNLSQSINCLLWLPMVTRHQRNPRNPRNQLVVPFDPSNDSIIVSKQSQNFPEGPTFVA